MEFKSGNILDIRKVITKITFLTIQKSDFIIFLWDFETLLFVGNFGKSDLFSIYLTTFDFTENPEIHLTFIRLPRK